MYETVTAYRECYYLFTVRVSIFPYVNVDYHMIFVVLSMCPPALYRNILCFVKNLKQTKWCFSWFWQAV